MSYKHQARKNPTAWIIVADRGQARIFAAESPDQMDLGLVFEFESPHGHDRQGEVDTDRQGYFQGKNGSMSAGQRQTDFKHQMSERFASQIVEHLEQGRQKNQYGRLVIVAPPLFLGVLREKLPAPLVQLVVLEIDKDYSQFTPADVRKHLPDAL